MAMLYVLLTTGLIKKIRIVGVNVVLKMIFSLVLPLSIFLPVCAVWLFFQAVRSLDKHLLASYVKVSPSASV